MIPKRLFWFAAGVATGAVGAAYGYVRVREARGAVSPDRVADTVVGAARTVGGGVRDAVVAGREAMHEAEARIQADLDRR
ncbi:MAG: hypothetical protein U0Q07_01750 [Acidimicrobiales bacterium]